MIPTTPSAADAWIAADPCGCPICGLEACEDVAHLAPLDDTAPIDGADLTSDRGQTSSDDAEAREARRAARLGDEIERQRISREARRRLDAEDRGPIDAPEFVALTALAAEPDPAVAWRIEGWQPAESRVVLAAQRKTGKTTIAGGLVRSLVDGDPFLGVARVEPLAGAVAVLDTEMSRRQLRAWYWAQGIRRAADVLIVPLRGRAGLLDLFDPAIRARWAAWLRDRGVQYLIVDCLRPILDALGLDESREAGRWLVALDALLREAGIPEACVVHHMGHTAERSRGDSRLRDWPDVEWRLMRQDEGDSSPRYIAAYGRDVDVPEAQLDYDRETRRLTIVGGSRGEARTARALAAVVEVLTEAGEAMTGRQIEAALAESDHPREAIRGGLREGTRTGQLAAEDGPRRSRLYRPGATSAPVRGSAPSAPAQSPAESVRQCASAYTDTRAQRTLGTLSDGSQPLVRRPRTGRTAARNTPATRRRSAEGDV
jgi:hypothetical protein